MKHLKNIQRGRIQAYAEKYPGATYTAADYALDFNPLWGHRADCAFPCATQNEINDKDAANLLANGVYLVSEGANMPSEQAAIDAFQDAKILFAPSKAANAGGVATSGLEMSQNSMRLAWTREEVDGKLHQIMKAIHSSCVEAADRFGTPGNYVNGANIAGFLKVADAMLALPEFLAGIEKAAAGDLHGAVGAVDLGEVASGEGHAAAGLLDDPSTVGKLPA